MLATIFNYMIYEDWNEVLNKKVQIEQGCTSQFSSATMNHEFKGKKKEEAKNQGMAYASQQRWLPSL
jgi:hypothetical protein